MFIYLCSIQLGPVVLIISLYAWRFYYEGKYTQMNHMESYKPMTSARPRLTRKNNIHFLKMHKTGSTTLFGILNRAALHNSLRTTTFSVRPYFSDNKDGLVRNLVPRFIVGTSKRYDIHTHHSRNDHKYLSKILNTPYVNITFMRNPTSLLRSWIYEFHLDKLIGFVGQKQPLTYFFKAIEKHKDRPPPLVERTKNIMADTFSIDRDLNYQSVTFKQYLEDIERDFIVGITEYYLESLVLIRRRLNWPLKDFIYVLLRRTPHRRGTVEDAQLNKTVCAWSPLDCQLYDHFNRTFAALIEKEGQNFREEVTHFRKMLDTTSEYCTGVYKHLKVTPAHIERLNRTTTPLTFPKSRWNSEFKISVIDCALMRVDEFPMANLFYYIQNRRQCFQVRRTGRCLIEWRAMGRNMCRYICLSVRSKRTMVTNFLKDPKVYLWN